MDVMFEASSPIFTIFMNFDKLVKACEEIKEVQKEDLVSSFLEAIILKDLPKKNVNEIRPMDLRKK